MKRFLIVFSIFLPSFLLAQHTEIGFLLGASNYIGELSNNQSTFYWQETKPAFGFFGKYNHNSMVALRGGLNFSSVSGEDSNSENKSISERNLSFQSRIIELSLIGEFNFPGYQPYALAKPFSPFLFGGIALANFNPKADFNGESVALQPLGTEGQGIPGFARPYSKTTLAIPFGAGLKWALNDAINVGFEVGARLTFTDYLDDVGGVFADNDALIQGNGELAAALANRTGELLGTDPVIVPAGTPRGDNTNNDWYFTAAFFVSYNFLDNGLVGIRKKIKRRRRGCYD